MGRLQYRPHYLTNFLLIIHSSSWCPALILVQQILPHNFDHSPGIFTSTCDILCSTSASRWRGSYLKRVFNASSCHLSKTRKGKKSVVPGSTAAWSDSTNINIAHIECLHHYSMADLLGPWQLTLNDPGRFSTEQVMWKNVTTNKGQENREKKVDEEKRAKWDLFYVWLCGQISIV